MRWRLPLLVAALSSMVMVQPVQADAPRSDGNGFIMMVHATFEPRPTEGTPVFVPPAQEGLAATRHDGVIVFNVIPHRLDGRPAMVSDPVLQITDLAGENELLVPANGVSTSQRECIEETAYAGYEGPVEACRVFRLPASALATMPLVLLTLRFVDGGRPGAEVNNPAAHGLLHARQHGTPVDLASVDSRLTGQSIPFAVLDLYVPTFGTG
jgi:hypothetical protein